MIACRQASRSPPVERSISVSAPYCCAQRSFSTSSSVPLATGEAPMLALILVVIMRPMPVGSRRFGARDPASTVGSSIEIRALRDRLVDPERGVVRAAGMAAQPLGRPRRRSLARRLAAAAGEVAQVGGNHQAPARDLGADHLGSDAFALRHPRHLRGDRAGASRLELRLDLRHVASLRRHDPGQVRGVGSRSALSAEHPAPPAFGTHDAPAATPQSSAVAVLGFGGRAGALCRP